MLLMKYGVHGQGHGHFDKLHFVFFDGGNEVVPDYGFSRWINIEPKFGGRYLPENDTYAMQTVAHNTVVVDQRTQNDANEARDEAVWPERHFFDATNPAVQAMSAKTDKHYAGVAEQRTMRKICIDARQRLIFVDPILGEQTRNHAFSDTTFFSTYEMHFTHGRERARRRALCQATAAPRGRAGHDGSR